MTITCAPVVVFAYRRPEHLRRTLESLLRCPESAHTQFIVYCDGPRQGAEVADVEATRRVAVELLGSRAEYHFADANMGLSRSVIGGVTDVVERFGRAIVVEDDLELDQGFLAFMNAGLERYSDEDAVYQVSGYMFDIPEFEQRRTALFLPLTVSWGWATWKRAWDRFDAGAEGWQRLSRDPALRRRFNLDGAFDYANMLMRQMAGLQDSWAIRWYWTVFSRGGMVLFPPASLVDNTGFDGSGTHGRGVLTRFGLATSRCAVRNVKLPVGVGVDEGDFAVVKRSLWRINGGWPAYWARRLRRLLRR